MADDLDADWRAWRDAVCQFTVNLVPDSVARVKNMLNPANVLGTGCEVQKHADCCALCRANTRCENLPVHPNCRCRPRGVLTSEHIAGGELGANPSFGSTQGVRHGFGSN